MRLRKERKGKDYMNRKVEFEKLDEGISLVPQTTCSWKYISVGEPNRGHGQKGNPNRGHGQKENPNRGHRQSFQVPTDVKDQLMSSNN